MVTGNRSIATKAALQWQHSSDGQKTHVAIISPTLHEIGELLSASKPTETTFFH
jgi:hypothetical protein